MPTYSNYITNPSFELGTSGWTAENSATLTRVTTAPTSGTYVLSMSKDAAQNVFSGAATIATITPAASQPYTLSLTIKNATESTDSTYNAGIKVTVYDLLPGESMGSRQQRATNTFARTTSGRVAIRNFTPRATADRIVVVVATASTYFVAAHTSTTYQATSQNFATSGAATSFYNSLPSIRRIRTPYLASGLWWVDYYNEIGIYVPEVSGGTSSVQIDAVQLEQGTTEATYSDGSLLGYAWAGSPHASATLAMLQLEAHGAASSTGTARVHRLIYIEAHAVADSTGTMEGYLIGVGASAFARSTGSLRLWQYGPMSASGTIAHSESIEIAALVPIEAHGAASSTGTLTAIIAAVSGADAFAMSVGTVDIGLPPDIEAHGFAHSVGTLEMAIAGVMSAHAFAHSVGTLDIGQLIPDGAFADFAIFGVTENDPLMTITGGSNGGTNTGATGADWVRIYGEFVAPQEVLSGTTRLWPRAAFVVPGIRFNALPAGSWQEFTRVQLEVSQSIGGPTTYQDGGSVRPLVYPDRLNLAPNVINIAAPAVPLFTTADESTSPIDDDTAPMLVVEIENGFEYLISTALNWLKPNATYTISMYVKPSTGMADVGFTAMDQRTGMPVSPVALYSTGTNASADLGAGWRRISAIATVPISGGVTLTYQWSVIEPQTGTESFSVAGFLVEEGVELNPYFFNPENDPEIRYHIGSTTPADGVFLYNDYERKTYILGEALQDYVPEGIGIGELEFGKIPHYDS